MSPRASLFAKLGLALLTSCLTLAALELAFRLYHRLHHAIPLWPGPAGLARYAEDGRGRPLAPIVLDDVLGWRSTPNYAYRGARRNSDGSAYEVSISFDGGGFRTFGPAASGRPTILAIGDSFTQAVEVSDGEGYHAILAEALGAAVFAYGAGGYGTLQEYLILDAHADRIRPDILLWQYCSNDFFNNTPGMERGSAFSNNGLTRPYWVDGQVEYILPKPDPLGLRTLAMRHARLGYWALSRWDAAQRGLFGGSATGTEHDIEREAFQHAGFREAMAITDELMAGVRRRVGAIPIVAFSCDARWPYHDALRGISERHGIAFLDEVANSIEESEQRGIPAQVEDGHWNPRGHRLAAGAILAHLRRRQLVGD